MFSVWSVSSRENCFASSLHDSTAYINRRDRPSWTVLSSVNFAPFYGVLWTPNPDIHGACCIFCLVRWKERPSPTGSRKQCVVHVPNVWTRPFIFTESALCVLVAFTQYFKKNLQRLTASFAMILIYETRSASQYFLFQIQYTAIFFFKKEVSWFQDISTFIIWLHFIPNSFCTCACNWFHFHFQNGGWYQRNTCSNGWCLIRA